MTSSTANRSGSHPDPERLSLRWFVILTTAGASGTAIGAITDVSLGVGIGLAVIGLLHTILDR
ncbi:hypothetical protein BJY24_000137 [Nocardia transvalensis]|uniref:Uncharacterized protein n=1 Tax=Nocardia transvalensis TaxID=37333 RepID=A0A7W9P8B1_9NOCA|nr:hypothetical protein [Nocardia transvalensis]MBB5911270.1 hypothetical protein [Nocardia transvalensis]